MSTNTSDKRAGTYRIPLSDQLVARFGDKVFHVPVSRTAKRTGLPYLLVYNIVQRRVKSISARHYRIIFQEAPSPAGALKVDGAFFRKMAELWIYLQGGRAKAELYREFIDGPPGRRVDYRLFSGRIQSVDPELERRMLEKFEASGLDRVAVLHWIDEMARGAHDARVPYGQVRPLLMFIQETLGVHPASLLRQVFERYERGQLKTVSQEVYARALALREEARKALASGRAPTDAKLREQIYGPKAGYALYADVADELAFLKNHARKGPKRYLGRSLDPYRKGKCKHIAAWRAQRIFEECAALIGQTPDLPLNSLPRSQRKRLVLPLLAVLVSRATEMLSRAEGLAFEKQVLRPRRARDEYKKQIHGFTQFDRASHTLGMKKKAFDLMVATNCEIFREVGRYDQRWYLSDLYLKELVAQQSFEMISVKYELMARRVERLRKGDDCMYY
ncbi:MAG: hypothetical protein WAU91_14295 [Desulfatitalea sp.]